VQRNQLAQVDWYISIYACMKLRSIYSNNKIMVLILNLKG